MKQHPITVLINGVSGKMGCAIVKSCANRQIEVVPVSLTSGEEREVIVGGPDGLKVSLYNIDKNGREAVSKIKAKVEKEGKVLIAIDYTLPNAALQAAEFFTSLEIPFVMGTTGFDSDAMNKIMETSKVSALIAPNMCKQIVALQSMLEFAAINYPSSFQGYSLSITESHQSTKVDTSGTAKALLQSMNSLTSPTSSLDVADITKIRDPVQQKELGVKEQHLKGHAWHTYTLDQESSEEAARFQFVHNISGRATYAEGTVDAVIFLYLQISGGLEKAKVFNMIDVLKHGEL